MFYPDILVLMSASALKPLDLAYVIMPLRSLHSLADHHNRVSNWMRSSRDVDVFVRVDQIENITKKYLRKKYLRKKYLQKKYLQKKYLRKKYLRKKYLLKKYL